MVVILSSAILPLIVLTAVIAWTDYRNTRRRAEERVLLARENAVARIQTKLEFAGDVVTWLQRSATASALFTETRDAPLDCADVFGGMVIRPERYPAIGVMRTNGTAVCLGWGQPTAEDASNIAASTAQSTWLAETLRADQPVIDFEKGTKSDARLVVVAGRVVIDGAVRGAAFVGLDADRLVADRGAGIALALMRETAGAARNFTELDMSGPAPSLAALQRMRQNGTVEFAREPSGTTRANAVAALPGGIDLLVGYDVGAALSAAWSLLAWRLAEITVILLIGLAATLVGADLSIVRPVTRLSVAVRQWRAGQAFAPRGRHDDPTEVAELSDAFRAATSELRAALAMRDLAMQEIHHRVKNNLQVVASLLNLQAGRLRQPETRAEFQAARDRVRALATLHRHLYSHGDLQRLNMRPFLMELCGQIFSAMGETEGERIALTIAAPELAMTSDQAVPLALIVTEAVTNALKYAFPDKRKGHVSVRLDVANGDMRLFIDDDGVGMPEGATETESGRRDGLGLLLIRGFARQIGARLVVVVDGGTHYALDIPPPGAAVGMDMPEPAADASPDLVPRHGAR